MESVIFLHSKGADKRRDILKILYYQSQNKEMHCITCLAKKFKVSKVTMKETIDGLIKLMYIEKINPLGKPIFLKLTEKGLVTAKKYLLY